MKLMILLNNLYKNIILIIYIHYIYIINNINYAMY